MAQAIQPSSETELTRLDAEHQEQIEACVERTQWSVKAVDVATGLVSLAAGIVAYLLLLTLVDHWVVSLSTSLRFAALVVLLLGVASFLGVWFVPIVVREVNPLYAARVIEQSAPSLKNSLLNLLLLSRRPEAVRPMIFSGLRRQAAEQIATLPQGSPVDHGPLIVAGYWLAGLVAVAATYKLLSPKDPFQSAARVVAPWEAIERPARVRIAEVRPGDTSVYRGQTLEVTATLQGLREDETAEVVLSAPDGRPPRVLALRAVGGDARTFTASMRLDDQDLPGEMNYHLRAGDARSRDFRLELLDAPHIAVESVTYEYPAYTGLAPRQDSQSGDLVAVEGTRVRITARANQPIQDAYLELFAPASDKAAGKLEGAGGSRASEESNTQTRPVQALPMQVVASGGASHEAQGRLTLLLDKNRSSSPFTAYQLRFKNSRGDTSDEAVRHRIQVTADLAPVVEILAPLDREVRVPLYGRMQFEVRALDPDFALSAVRLRGTQAEVARWNESLLAKAPHSGQFTRKVTLVPARLGLKPGQELMVWAEADDNRQSIAGAAEPNTTRTAAWRVLVTEPEAKPNRGDGEGEGDQASSRPGDSKSAEENEAGEGQGGSEQGGSEQGGSEQGGSEQGGSEQGGSEQGGSEQGGSEQSGSEQGGSEQGGSEQGGSEQGGEGNESGEGTGDSSGEASAGAEPGKENGKGASGASPQGDPAGESTAEASPEESGGDSTGQSGAGDAGEQSSEAASPSEESNPLPSDGSRDGDAFERILKRMREQNSGSGGEGEEGATPEESSEDVGGGGKSPAGQKPQASSRDATRQRTPKEPSGEGTAADDGTSSGGDATGNSDKRSADDESGPSESPESGTPSNSQGRGKPKSSGTGTSTRPKTSAGTDGEAAQAGVEDANADDPRASDAGDADTGTAGDSSQGAGQGNQGTGSDSRTGERSSTGSESESPGASSNRGEQNATDGPSEGAPGSAEAGNERSQSPDARANEATEGGSPSPAQGAASKTPEAGAEGAEGSAESDSSVGDPSGARPPEAVSDGAEETADGDAEAGPRGANDAGKQGSRGSQGRAGARPEASDGEATAGDLANPEGEKGGGQPAAGAEGSSRPEASSAKGSEPSKEAPTPNGDDAGEERVGDSAGPSRGGGQGGRAEGETLDAAAPTADEANLEYANKATAMALEYLKDRPQDGELLERLGWTPAEMKAFVDRWQRMRSATGAERDRGGQAAERLNDQLRGLGLRPPNARVRSNRQPKDAGATLRQGGAASVLPSEYQEQFRAFLKSVPEPSRSGAAERPRGSQ